MAKFVLISSRLLNKFISKLGDSNKVVQSVIRAQPGLRHDYRGAMGKDLPNDKTMVPTSLFKKLVSQSKMKPSNPDASFMMEHGKEIETFQDRKAGRKTKGYDPFQQGLASSGNRHRMRDKIAEAKKQSGHPNPFGRDKVIADYYRAKRQGKNPSWPDGIGGPEPGSLRNQYYKK